MPPESDDVIPAALTEIVWRDSTNKHRQVRLDQVLLTGCAQSSGVRHTLSAAEHSLLQAGFVARTTKPATGAPASLRSSADSAAAVSPDWVSTRFTYARLWL